jgi:putative intracellular protease/amidase
MIIGMPVYDDVELMDVTGPYEMFQWAGLDIELVDFCPVPPVIIPPRRAAPPRFLNHWVAVSRGRQGGTAACANP